MEGMEGRNGRKQGKARAMPMPMPMPVQTLQKKTRRITPLLSAKITKGESKREFLTTILHGPGRIEETKRENSLGLEYAIKLSS